jgi:hypothetical protein
MKRLWVLITGIALFLTACAAPLAARPPEVVPSLSRETVVAPAVSPTQTPAAAPQPLPTEEAAPLIPATGAEETEPDQAASVDVDGLNLRVGPGLNHRILGVLSLGAQVQVQGRSVDGEWIAVRLADGTDGWLFGAFLKSEVDFANLPVLEAYGGPLGEQPQPAAEVDLPGEYTLYMTIADSQATVSLTDFPAGSEVTLRLAARGEGPSMTVATGRTDANGAAVIGFEMPRYWADGSPLSQSELKLVATSADGSISRSASIVYYQSQ